MTQMYAQMYVCALNSQLVPCALNNVRSMCAQFVRSILMHRLTDRLIASHRLIVCIAFYCIASTDDGRITEGDGLAEEASECEV